MLPIVDVNSRSQLRQASSLMTVVARRPRGCITAEANYSPGILAKDATDETGSSRASCTFILHVPS